MLLSPKQPSIHALRAVFLGGTSCSLCGPLQSPLVCPVRWRASLGGCRRPGRPSRRSQAPGWCDAALRLARQAGRAVWVLEVSSRLPALKFGAAPVRTQPVAPPWRPGPADGSAVQAFLLPPLPQRLRKASRRRPCSCDASIAGLLMTANALSLSPAAISSCVRRSSHPCQVWQVRPGPKAGARVALAWPLAGQRQLWRVLQGGPLCQSRAARGAACAPTAA